MTPGLVGALILAVVAPGVASSDAARLSALEATCLAGRTEKCLEAGRGRLLAGERDAAVGLYAKACTGGLPEGCLGLATRSAGLAFEARERGDSAEAGAHADKGLQLLRQATKDLPNSLAAADCEGWLSRLKATLTKGREATSWTQRAKAAEGRAEALRQALGGGYAPDVFWRPPAGALASP